MKCNKSQQLKMGQAIEMEHTTNPTIARRIASDHLKENKCYYTYLKKAEKHFKVKL